MTDTSAADGPAVAPDYPKPTRTLAPMPLWWRGAILGGVLACGGLAYLLQPTLGTRGQAGFGILCFLGIAAAFSRNLRGVSLKTFGWGVAIQFVLAAAVLYVKPVDDFFQLVGKGITILIDCSNKGAEFVFGVLAKPGEIEKFAGPQNAFVFAFKALPPIIFISGFFSVLYYFGVLQLIVSAFAWVMRYVMGTSGAETLSVSANVFMGQTEAPLIVKPYVPRMTESELLTLMASGMAHISGGMMAVYISYGADPVSILCTCVMACPCSLYLAKLVIPELAVPVTSPEGQAAEPKTAGTPTTDPDAPVNAIDAASKGIKDGLFLALNVAAMLIGFLAFIELFDQLIKAYEPDWSLKRIFGVAFSPLAFLIGVPLEECNTVGSLLGTKLAANEHVAYTDLKGILAEHRISDHSRRLAVFALSGFANFASIGIQLGGIGAIAPSRRADLARLGLKALFVGFLVTLINASVAGLLAPELSTQLPPPKTR